MYTTIKARVTDQALQVTNIPKLASGGENVIRVEVTFDGMWDGLGKTAIFYRKENQVYHVVMKNDACITPREVMTEPGLLYFGIIGTDGGTVRTTEVVVLSVDQGAITGQFPLEPLPDVYKQLLSAYATTAHELAVEKARLDNILANGGTTDDAELVDVRVGADGLTYENAGEAVRQQIRSFTRANRVSADNTENGCYVFYETGEKGAHANYSTVTLVVRSGEKYHISDTDNSHIAYFAGEQSVDNYVDGANNAEYVTIPEGATVMTVSVKTANLPDLQVYTRIANDDLFNGEVAFEKLTPELQAHLKKTVVVGTDGDYTSLLEAMKENGENTRYFVLAGTYNVHEEYEAYYGDDYFSTYRGYAGSVDKFDAGLYLQGGCELIGVGEVNIVFNYTGDNVAVKQYFSPLNTTQNNVVDNINFSIGNDSCRYIIHDDFASKCGTNIFRNCTLHGASYLTTSMGCGMGTANTYVIEGCCFTGNTGIDIAYHNNVFAGENKVIVRNCHCTGSIRGAHYGTSEIMSKMIVSGCKASRVYLVHGDETAYPNVNVELVAWNNVES